MLLTVIYALTCQDSVAFRQCDARWKAQRDLECNEKLKLNEGFTTSLQTANREACLCEMGPSRDACFDLCREFDHKDPNVAKSSKALAQSETDAHCMAALQYEIPEELEEEAGDSETNIPPVTRILEASNTTDFLSRVQGDDELASRLKLGTTTTESASGMLLVSCYYLINMVL